jgi:hypothetical protein
MGYEFDWGQIIEEVFDGIPAADSDNLKDPSYLAVRLALRPLRHRVS